LLLNSNSLFQDTKFYYDYLITRETKFICAKLISINSSILYKRIEMIYLQ